MKNILFIAPPAGGKGTLSEKLEKDFGYEHISSGDLLRNITDSKLHEKILKIQNSGKLVDDETVLELLKNKLIEIKGKPFVLDGFPRNINQAKLLDECLKELDLKLDIVINLEVSYEICLSRVIDRLVCNNCGMSFNSKFLKPKLENICDECGFELVKRTDDNEETFKKRFDTYQKTLPLIDYYNDKVITVDGINNTYETIVSVINND